ncbi:unnamed protein product [Symbiodinium sp. CCMP2592]|nr:unnamed protein product [Symbiodinium sp. CCMP2592]
MQSQPRRIFLGMLNQDNLQLKLESSWEIRSRTRRTPSWLWVRLSTPSSRAHQCLGSGRMMLQTSA